MAEVFVDELFTAESRNAQAYHVGERTGHRWCHMWSDDLAALHSLAARIGLKRAWFQAREGFPHYDLTPRKRDFALRLGAREKPLRDWFKEKRSGENTPYATTIRHTPVQNELFASPGPDRSFRD